MRKLLFGLILSFLMVPSQGAEPVKASAPVAIIGVVECRTFVGAYLIDKDGNITILSSDQLTIAQASEIAKSLGEGHNAVTQVPCPGVST